MNTPTDVSFDFTGRTVLVTRGGSGIGLATAEAFARSGANVVITGRTQGRLDTALERLPTDRATAVRADVGLPDDVERITRSVHEQFGRLDVVISNAAGYVPGEITDVSTDDWELMRRTTIDGLFHLAKTTLPSLADTGGSFIATSSVSGLGGDWKLSTYNATKGAVTQFVRALALDWGSRGVRVNAVAPSLTKTEPVVSMTGNPELVAKHEERTALGRLGEPEDVAPVFLFLASDAARYITGAVLPVDGGTTASNGQPHV